MLSLNIGPLALSMVWVVVLLSLLTANGVAWYLLRHQQSKLDTQIFALAFFGLIFARLAFVLMHWPDYQNNPLGMLNIRDGGLNWLWGLVALSVATMILSFKQRQIQKALCLSVGAGVVVSVLGFGLLHAAEKKKHLPNITVSNLAGQKIELSALKGKPVVLNLWATWCPPCQREMPILQAAQAQNPDVMIVLVNQGESAAAINQYLKQENLQLQNLYLDSSASVGKSVDSRLLPTTLFYDKTGQLQASHLGELSHASLGSFIQKISD